MSLNCIETKLKGVVNNSSLLKPGEFVIDCNLNTIDSELSSIYLIVGSKPCTLRVLENIPAMGTSPADVANNPKTTITLPAGFDGSIYFRSDIEYKVAIGSKYTITEFNSTLTSVHVDLAEFDYCSSIRVLKNSVYKSGAVTGSLESLSELTTMQEISLYNTAVVGDISALGKLISLVYFSLTASDNITGSLESLAEQQVANGRTSGTLVIKPNETITAQSQPLSSSDTATITFNSSVAGGYSISISH